MHPSTKTVSIIVAVVLAVGMIGGAFFLSSPLTTPTVSAEGMEELLAAYSKKDSDTDGLPDWKEALYATDPSDPHSVDPKLTDGEAVEQGLVQPKFETEELGPVDPDSLPGTAPEPSSVTEAFSRMFFEQYTTASGGQVMSQEDEAALIAALTKSLGAEIGKVLQSKYTIANVETSPDVSSTVYAGRLESVLWEPVSATDSTQETTDIYTLIQDYIERGDKNAGKTIEALGRGYKAKVELLAKVEVPSHLASAQLSLMRGYDTYAKALLLIADFEDDPLPVLGALSVLKPTSQSLSAAVNTIAVSVLKEGRPAAGAPGAVLVETAFPTP